MADHLLGLRVRISPGHRCMCCVLYSKDKKAKHQDNQDNEVRIMYKERTKESFAGGMNICLCECCVSSGRSLYDGPIPRPEEFYRLWCVILYDLETSIMRWPENKNKSLKKGKVIYAKLL